MTIRTRIAPSPTGNPHVGTAYIALFNYCFAISQGGEFILRIEDTDQVRSTAESEQAILDSLKWLGLKWSEGPDIGGPFGPYRQSERSEIYRQYAEELIQKGHAFYCYRTPAELDELREARRAAGGFTALKPSELKLSDEEIEKRKAEGMQPVVRMMVPEENGPCPVQDMLRGIIELDWGQVDAQILLKSDGMPTYHLANVVDDHLMGITHVIRGEEWINSAPKHLLLYQYFGWVPPALCHMPLLRNPDKSKLSKRKNPTSINYYRRMGFMPEAVLNYLGRMGWSMPDESEKFNLATMVDHFDIQRVSLGGPIFDLEKLSWLNGQWLRELSVEDFADRVQQWAFNKEYFMQIASLVKDRVELFSDITPLAGFFCAGMLKLTPEQFAHKSLQQEDCVRVIQYSLWLLENDQHWAAEHLESRLKSLAEKLDLKIRDFLFPLFVAIAGTPVSTSLFDSMAVLGPDLSCARMRSAVELLGGVSKKQTKKWEKDFQVLLAQIDS